MQIGSRTAVKLIDELEYPTFAKQNMKGKFELVSNPEQKSINIEALKNAIRRGGLESYFLYKREKDNVIEHHIHLNNSSETYYFLDPHTPESVAEYVYRAQQKINREAV